MDIRRQQDIEYNQGLREDILKDIRRDREAIRLNVQHLLQSKVAYVAEGSLNANDTRLLRLYKSRPNLLNDMETMKAKEIMKSLERLEMGGCYNLTPAQEKALNGKGHLMKLKIPGVAFTVCASVLESLTHGGVDERHGFVDAIIHLGSEVIRYPLSPDEIEDFMGIALTAGLDVERRDLYPPMKHVDLDAVIANLAQLKV